MSPYVIINYSKKVLALRAEDGILVPLHESCISGALQKGPTGKQASEPGRVSGSAEPNQLDTSSLAHRWTGSKTNVPPSSLLAVAQEKITAMSLLLQVYRAKPNPAGKDRTRSGPKPEQLVAEWADIKNVGARSVPFASMQLHHTKFGRTCSEVVGTEKYWSSVGQEALKPGQIIRVHTGSKRYEATLSAEDQGTVEWRGFAERPNFVLNNDCGDVISILWLNEHGQWWRDSAGYDPHPPEGAVLVRVGDRLRPAPVSVY